jgi:hypothetical protein
MTAEAHSMPALTERRYRSLVFAFRCAASEGWARQDSNLGPRDYESPALTAELQARLFLEKCIVFGNVANPESIRAALIPTVVASLPLSYTNERALYGCSVRCLSGTDALRTAHTTATLSRSHAAQILLHRHKLERNAAGLINNRLISMESTSQIKLHTWKCRH